MKVGSFVAATATGVQTVPVAGLGVGKWIKFFGTQQTVDATFGAGAAMHLSFVKDTAQRENLCKFYDDNVNPTNGWIDWAQCAIKMLADGNGTVDCIADSFAWVPGTGFSINWTDAPNAAYIINYVIYEDTEVEQVDIHTIDLPASITPGTATKTGMTFAPDTFQFAAMNQSTARGGMSSYIGWGHGWATAIGNEACYACAAFDAITTGSTGVKRYERVDRCIALLTSTGVVNEAQLTALNSDGYTLKSQVASQIRRVIVVAMKKNVSSSWKIVIANGLTAPGNLDVTGFGFDPVGLEYNGGFHVANNTVQLADDDYQMSAAEAPNDSRLAHCICGNNTVPSRGKRITGPEFIRHYSTPANTLIGNVSYTLGIADGVRLNFALAPSTSRRILLMGIKPGTVPPPDLPPAQPTGVVATPGDTQVSLNWDDNTEPDLAGYNVYRSLTSTVPLTSPINGALLTSSAYVDTGLANGTAYHYVVEAVDAGGFKAQAAQVVATPLAPAPPGPGPIVLPSDRLGIYKVEIAWSSALKGVFVVDVSTVGGTDGLGGSSYNSPFGGPYDDITRRSDNNVRVESVQWTKGRSDDLAEMQALSGTLTVRDPDGMLDVNNPASPLNIGNVTNGSIRPLRPIRITCYFAGVWWPVLFGFIRSVDYEPQGRTGTANIEFTDLFSFLETPRQDQPGVAPQPVIAYTTVDANGDPITTGGAIGLLLDWIGWKDQTLRQLDPGDAIPFFEAVGDKGALTAIADVMRPNLGTFFVNNAGATVFEDRNTPFAAPVLVTIDSEMKALGSGIALDRIRNKWTVTRQTRSGPGQYADATPQVSTDFQSSNDYGERSDSFSSPFLMSDSQALQIADLLVSVTKQPFGTLWRLAIDNRTAELMYDMLVIDLHSKIQVAAAKTGASGVFFVEQISGRIDAAGHKHSVSYILSDRIAGTLAAANVFIVGTSTVGGTDTLAF